MISVEHLPSTLRSFNFHIASAHGVDVPAEWYLTLFATLPRGLRELTTKIALPVVDCTRAHYAEIFACLPPQLRSLDVDVVDKSVGPHAPNNPDAVVSSGAVQAPPHADDICLSMLPRSLRTLRVGVHHFSLAALDAVMPALRGLAISLATSEPYRDDLLPRLEVAVIGTPPPF